MTAHGASVELAARRQALRQAFVASWAGLACLLVLVHAPVELRAPIVIVFFCFVPGTALVGLFNPDSFGVEVSLSVALSVAVSGLAAGLLVYAHIWSPTAVVVIVTSISLAAGLRDVRLRSWGGRARSLPVALLQAVQVAGRAAGSVSGGMAAVPRRAGRVGPRPLRRIAPRSRPDRPEGPPSPAPASALQGFLLDELKQRRGTAAQRTRRRRPPSLADLEPDELTELLSWSSLQRYVTQRAIREVKPELWFVEDLDRRLGSQPPLDRSDRTPSAPRGVWITGVSAQTRIPIAWRVLENHGKDWRTRLALETIDALPEPGIGEAVVAADTDYGTLTGFRRGLTTRGISYLFRVDPATAARELAPDRPRPSAAEARDILREHLGAPTRPHDPGEETDLVLAQGVEHIVVCEAPATEKAGAFWISNLPVETPRERLASLIRLANRGRTEPETAYLLQVALKLAAEGGSGLDRELALVALAGGLQALHASTANGDESR